MRVERIGDLYFANLDGVVLEFQDIRRGKDGGIHAHVTATVEGNVVGWAPLQLGSPTSRKTYLLGCHAAVASADLMEACRQVDHLWRESFTPATLTPRKPRPDSWLVPRWMPLRGTSIVYADGDAGKSYFALAFAASALAGRTFGPWSIAPVQRVLYLDFEDTQETHEERLYGILGPANLPDPGDRLRYMDMQGSVLSDLIDRVRQLCAAERVDLVIVDSLAAASGGEVEGAEAAIRTLSALRSLTMASRIVLGHVNAMGAAQTEGIPRLYGSVYNRNLARALIWLAKEDIGEAGVEKVWTAHLEKHNKGTGQRPTGFRAIFTDDPDATDVLITAAEADYSRASPTLRIIEALRRGAREPQQIADAVGMKANAVRVYLGRLEKRNIVSNRIATVGGRGKEGEWFLVDRNRNSEEP